MWHTATGDRILKGAEAQIFATSVYIMVRREREGDGTDRYGIPVFDALTSSQKIAMLHQVTQALLRPEVPMPELTAVSEGTIAAVLQHVYMLLEFEVLANPDSAIFRSLVAKACRRIVKRREPEDRKVPADFCEGREEWEFCMELMHDAILWDFDYLEEDLLVDLPPEQGEVVKEGMRIAPGYFQAIAHDPSEQQVAILCGELETLCRNAFEPDSTKAAKSRRKPSAKKTAAKKAGVKKAAVKKPAAKNPAGTKASRLSTKAGRSSTKRRAHE